MPEDNKTSFRIWLSNLRRNFSFTFIKELIEAIPEAYTSGYIFREHPSFKQMLTEDQYNFFCNTTPALEIFSEMEAFFGKKSEAKNEGRANLSIMAIELYALQEKKYSVFTGFVELIKEQAKSENLPGAFKACMAILWLLNNKPITLHEELDKYRGRIQTKGVNLEDMFNIDNKQLTLKEDVFVQELNNSINYFFSAPLKDKTNDTLKNRAEFICFIITKILSSPYKIDIDNLVNTLKNNIGVLNQAYLAASELLEHMQKTYPEKNQSLEEIKSQLKADGWRVQVRVSDNSVLGQSRVEEINDDEAPKVVL